MLTHIGLDDTDSRIGGCTTYTAFKLVSKLIENEARFVDYPNLVRLNPNIPWKTRGNGAVSLRLEHKDPEWVFEEACRIVDAEGFSKNPAVALLVGEVPEAVREIAEEALWRVVNRVRATEIARRAGVRLYARKGGFGVVGALAAIGNLLEEDHTYELLAYRVREMWSKPRMVDEASVIDMDRKTHPYTFNNYDEEKARVLVTPRGPDPVLLGIRGETPEVVLEAYRMMKVFEPTEGYMIFRSNQGTNAHLTHEIAEKLFKAYTSGYVKGEVSSKPWVEIGGHTYFKVRCSWGEVTCAVYEPTGQLRKVVLRLIPGDEVEVGGGVRKGTKKHHSVLNVEYIKVLRVAKELSYVNPLCPLCGKRMKSMGRLQGFRCKACGFKAKEAEKVMVERDRKIKPGIYLPPPRAQRHLTKPLHRYGMEKKRWIGGSIIKGWFHLSLT